jgi:hypothetical protein
MKEIRLASVALAAYLTNSALSGVVTTSGRFTRTRAA